MKVRRKKWRQKGSKNETKAERRRRLRALPPASGQWRADIEDREPRISGQTLNVVKGIGQPNRRKSMFHGHIYNAGVEYTQRLLEKMGIELAVIVHHPGEEYVEREQLVTPRQRRRLERLARREKEQRLVQLRLFKLKKKNAPIIQERKRLREAKVYQAAPARIPRKRKVKIRGSRV